MHMPLFFLHIRDGGTLIRDPEGSFLIDLQAARSQAIESAREFMAQGIAGRAVQGICRLASAKAKLGHIWPHMLRHSCGYYLADRGTDLRTMQDYLGHRDPKHTAHYTRVAGHRFEGLWR
jgi:site-specific recombinase XerD